MDHRILGMDLDGLRRDRTSVKWRVYAADVLPVWVAEMDAAPCHPVVDAVRAAVERGDTGYGLGTPYAAAMGRFAAETWGWVIDPDRTTAVADVMIGVTEILRVVTDPGARVVVSTPCYDSFFGFVDMIGRRVLESPLGADGRLDEASLAASFREAATDGGRPAYLLCNPQNPTGVAHTRDELAMVARLAQKHGVTVVADEIHAPLVIEGSFTPYLTVPGGEHGFSVISASKGWNLAGLKAALVISGDAVADELRVLDEMHTHGASHLGMIAHIAALDDGRDWREQLLVELDVNRRLLGSLLAERLPAVGYTPPAATYLAWLDCRGLALGDDPSETFLERGRVALSRGLNYGQAGRGFARFNLATSPAIITEAVERMATCTGGGTE